MRFSLEEQFRHGFAFVQENTGIPFWLGQRKGSLQNRQGLIHISLPLEGERLQNQRLDHPSQSGGILQLAKQHLRQRQGGVIFASSQVQVQQDQIQGFLVVRNFDIVCYAVDLDTALLDEISRPSQISLGNP